MMNHLKLETFDKRRSTGMPATYYEIHLARKARPGSPFSHSSPEACACGTVDCGVQGPLYRILVYDTRGMRSAAPAGRGTRWSC